MRSIIGPLAAEKRRRGVSRSSLVFVGMHNIAQYWWCGMYSVLKSRANEHEIYGGYLDGVDSFPWRNFVLIGVPDGITKRLVIEKKEAQNRFWFATASRPIAATQADLYGVLFKRKYKRVEIAIRDEGVVESVESPVDPARALVTLERFEAVVAGEMPAPPRAFKCSSCEFKSECELCQV